MSFYEQYSFACIACGQCNFIDSDPKQNGQMHSILWSLAFDWMWSAARPSKRTKHILLRHDPIPMYIYSVFSAQQTWNRYRFNCVRRLNATLYVFVRQTIWTEMTKRFSDKELGERDRFEKTCAVCAQFGGECISPTKVNWSEMVSVVCDQFHYNLHLKLDAVFCYIYIFISAS